MIKSIHDLTESDKRRFYEAMKSDYIRNYDIPWAVVEQRMKDYIDQAISDQLFLKMSPDDQIDASFYRKHFGNRKPSIYDFAIWQFAFTTHLDRIEIPD